MLPGKGLLGKVQIRLLSEGRETVVHHPADGGDGNGLDTSGEEQDEGNTAKAGEFHGENIVKKM